MTIAHMTEEMERCVRAALECYQVCLETKQYCIAEGGDHCTLEHLSTLDDCLELCLLTAQMMMRDSAYSLAMADLCADACGDCTESCEKFKDDQVMAECALACRACEKACKELIAAESDEEEEYAN